jgi:hypothetical protein
MNVLREDAINKLANHTSYRHNDTEILEWGNGEKPTEEQIETKRAEMELEWIAKEYSRNRQAEYPDFGSQLNKIYDDGITKWKTEMVDPIKAKFPKPT